MADDEQSVIQRLWVSFKYTIFFIIVACILLLTGMLMQPDKHEGIDLDWLRKFFTELAEGTGAMAFVAGVLALAGMGIVIFYTAPGLSLLPLHLLAGSKAIPGKSDETNALLAVNRERQNAILNRYQQFQHRPTAVMGAGGRGRNPVLSERDRQAMSELAQEEIMLANRFRRVQRWRDSWFHQCQFIIRPLQILLGLIGSALTVLLITSLAVTRQVFIGQTNDDICGAPCGYIFRGDLPNPLNMLFLKLSPYFPVDYVLIVMIILYMFWATTKGVISIGIRLLWINLYEFRRAATQPQGLLAATMLLMLSLAGLSYSLTMSVAPEYSMFGSQKYVRAFFALQNYFPKKNKCNHTIPDTGTRDCSNQPSLIVPCHIGAPSDLCVATVTSTTILKIIAATPSLGIAFFYMQWGFLATFSLALIFNLIQGCRRGFSVDPLDEGDEDLEEIEARGLLSGELNTEDGRRRARRRGLLAPGGGQRNEQENDQGYGAVGRR
ncbi:putative lysosomal cobalamin transporter [Mortierella sp. AD094]|nr:putative lysosomal cobalamin transporter [Mortierella sp. AD094]